MLRSVTSYRSTDPARTATGACLNPIANGRCVESAAWGVICLKVLTEMLDASNVLSQRGAPPASTRTTPPPCGRPTSIVAGGSPHQFDHQRSKPTRAPVGIARMEKLGGTGSESGHRNDPSVTICGESNVTCGRPTSEHGAPALRSTTPPASEPVAPCTS